MVYTKVKIEKGGYNRMDSSLVGKVVTELEKRMSRTDTLDLTLKNGREVIVHRDAEGYTLYEGCELVVGDTTIQVVAQAIIAVNRGARI
jgi:hypothetical protein